MPSLESGVTLALRNRFPWHGFDPGRVALIHRGWFANAIIFRYRDQAYDLAIKDFSHSPPLIRETLGRFFIAREHRILQHLKGVPGIAPGSCRLSDTMLAYPYVEGESLAALRRRGARLPATFFQALEKTVRAMHLRGIVHLDLRNLGNILCGIEGRPYLIDFQSALRIDRATRRLQALLRAADLSGVYKSWLALCDEPLALHKRRFLERFNQVRRLWPLRGYPLAGRLGRLS